jgi:hypothetical protein
LPQSHRLYHVDESETTRANSEEVEDGDRPQEENLDEPIASKLASPEQTAPESATPIPNGKNLRADPLGWLGQAAGYSDGESWWEHLVEQRRESDQLFAAILEAMTVLRSTAEAEELEASTPPDLLEAQREAHMRKTIREAQSQGFENIAVVCGAWHAPALINLPPAKQDNALLKGLPKIKVEVTWVPWTYGRLCYQSGYGAGVTSPGWYHHLWTTPSRVVMHWLIRVAQLLREQDLDASAASVIEAVRLAETLAALRDRPLPGLDELNEAIQTVLCFGDPLPMRLIHDKLMVGEQLGTVPNNTPMVPLQQDLLRQQKRLRLKPEAIERNLDLDLRQPTDLARSQLLHRLLMLNIPWGQLRTSSGKGTFKESWQLRWQPELAIALIEAGVWGNTLEEAAIAHTQDAAQRATDLPTLTQLLDQALLANLPAAIGQLMSRLQAEAAIATDITHLMTALPPLANILRYGNVRQIDTAMITHVVDGLITRIAIGLPIACSSLDDTAANQMDTQILDVNRVVQLLQNPDQQTTWQKVLRHLADQQSIHGLLAGRCCRLLLDAGGLNISEVSVRLSLALSTANEPPQAAAWVEGLLKGSGLLLIHHEALWQVLDQWVTSLTDENFIVLLPLLRRTFSTFAAPERQQMGEKVRQGNQGSIQALMPLAGSEAFDSDRADTVLPLLAQLLGISG